MELNGKLTPAHVDMQPPITLEIKKTFAEKVMSALDMDPMRTIVKRDLEKKFLFVKGSLKYAFFSCNQLTDKMEVKAFGVVKSLWENTSDNLKHTVLARECYIPNLKMSEHPKLIAGARTFLKKEGYDVTLIKDLRAIRFLIQYENKKNEQGYITSQLFYINDHGTPIQTEFIEGNF